jgi:hypothetical protein
MIDHKPLKLLAKELDDLTVISAFLQDAIIPIMSMSYDERLKTFSLLTDRFCHEHEPVIINDQLMHHRVHAAFQVHNVNGIKHRNFPKKDDPHHHQMLNLLAIQGEEKKIHVIFSGGAEMIMNVDDLECYLKDLNDPYPTPHKPEHVFDKSDEAVA